MCDRESVWGEGGWVGSSQGKVVSDLILKRSFLLLCGEKLSSAGLVNFLYDFGFSHFPWAVSPSH